MTGCSNALVAAGRPDTSPLWGRHLGSASLPLLAFFFSGEKEGRAQIRLPTSKDGIQKDPPAVDPGELLSSLNCCNRVSRSLRRYCVFHAGSLMVRSHTPDMKLLGNRNADQAPPPSVGPSRRTLAKRGRCLPQAKTALRAYVQFFSHAWVKYALGLVGLVVQMVLVVLTWELVQVATDIAEMWVALARKYLELTS